MTDLENDGRGLPLDEQMAYAEYDANFLNIIQPQIDEILGKCKELRQQQKLGEVISKGEIDTLRQMVINMKCDYGKIKQAADKAGVAYDESSSIELIDNWFEILSGAKSSDVHQKTCADYLDIEGLKKLREENPLEFLKALIRMRSFLAELDREVEDDG